jgi:hypothetical protein
MFAHSADVRQLGQRTGPRPRVCGIRGAFRIGFLGARPRPRLGDSRHPSREPTQRRAAASRWLLALRCNCRGRRQSQYASGAGLPTSAQAKR